MQFAYSQDCFQYYKTCEEYDGKSYQYDEHTGSFLLSNEKAIEIEIEAIKGINYKINICTEDFILPLHFVIKDKINNILFDNKSDNYANEFEFSVINNKMLIIVIDIDESCDNMEESCSGCVGILIKKAIKPRTGF